MIYYTNLLPIIITYVNYRHKILKTHNIIMCLIYLNSVNLSDKTSSPYLSKIMFITAIPIPSFCSF